MLGINQLNEKQKSEYEEFTSLYSESSYHELLKNVSEQLRTTKNIEVLSSYQNIIKKTAQLLDELQINDPIRINIVFEYLLWNGYFSKEKSLQYKIRDRINNLNYLGADIMKGSSVCLNNADMLSKILREKGYEAYTIISYIDPKSKAEYRYRPDIERKTQHSFLDNLSLIGRLLTKYLGNHACCFVKEDNIILDPTNLSLAYFNDLLNAKYFFSKQEMHIHPWGLIVLEELDKEKTFEIVEESFINSNNNKLTEKQIIYASEETIEKCKQETNLYDDFHIDIYKDIEKVNKTLIKK